MSRAENGYDNAFIESCFGTLKTELEMEPYANEHAARKEIPDYIRYDNTRRRGNGLCIGYHRAACIGQEPLPSHPGRSVS